MERLLTYGQAIKEATVQEMERDPSVIVMGLGVDDPKGTFGTTLGLIEKFGKDRVFDTPLAEDAMTGVAIGTALAGLRPIHVHQRMDFVLLAMNQLINIAAKSRYMYGGAVSVPIVIRAIIGRSWGQGAQHSQALQSFFMHTPGIKVVAPVTPYDAKGYTISAIRDENPVMIVEHRLLYNNTGHVPAESYALPLGQARVHVKGDDITIVGVSHMVMECLRAQSYLSKVGVNAEVIDLLSLSPLPMDIIIKSIQKTRKLLFVDNAWLTCGASAEVLARVSEWDNGQTHGIAVRRMGFEPVPCPGTKNLEDYFYPSSQSIASVAYSMIHSNKSWIPQSDEAPEIKTFKGPF